MPSGVRDTTAFVGFFIYISSIAILGIHRDSWYSLLDFTPGLYATWALVPKAILDLIGLSYLPNREWTILLPTFGMMLIFVAYIGHMLSMLILSPSLSSSALVNDGHARQIQETDCRSSGSLMRFYLGTKSVFKRNPDRFSMRPIRLVEFAGKTPFSVVIVPALVDNYSYLVIDKSTAMAVDPVDPPKIAKAVNTDWNLSCIATTHHHEYLAFPFPNNQRRDHSGGNVALSKMFPEVRVYGFDDRIPAITNKLSDQESFSLGHLRIEAIHCPCHTSGSLSYVVHDDCEDPSEQAVFTGDTLFLGGCGRFFEGSANDMYTALYQKIGKLSHATKIFVGHEYTLKNLEFALKVEPSNPKLKARFDALRKASLADPSIITMPGTLGEEWDTNPFMRLSSKEIITNTKARDPIQTMAALREMKNGFK